MNEEGQRCYFGVKVIERRAMILRWTDFERQAFLRDGVLVAGMGREVLAYQQDPVLL